MSRRMGMLGAVVAVMLLMVPAVASAAPADGAERKAGKGKKAKAAKPRLAGLKVTPRSAEIGSGERATFTASVRSVGKVPAKRVRLCLVTTKRAVSGSRCATVGKLRKGKKGSKKFTVSLGSAAEAGKSYNLVFKATAKKAKAKRTRGKLTARTSGGGGGGGGGDAPRQAITVCDHGCDFDTIQKAVDYVGETASVDASKTVIRVSPGTYVEGVRMMGHEFDQLMIEGTGAGPGDVILEGEDAKDPDGNPANNGIEARDVNGVILKNFHARNYQSNGVFIHSDENAEQNCNDYLVEDVWVSFNRSYGIYAFNCIGGRMTETVGWGHGDSAWYVGQTPPQANPVWTSIDNSIAYENVLGYSGTNSRYVNLHHNEVYNNGVGIVPNTLDSELYWPTSEGIIENNDIYWNNFNYFLEASSVQTVSNGLGPNPLDPGGDSRINYPTGVGVALFGATGWKVRNNNVFGNWMWGIAVFSDPFTTDPNDPSKLIGVSNRNEITNNNMGKGGQDLNAADLMHDGSGNGTCFSGNTLTSPVPHVFGVPGSGIPDTAEPWDQAELYPGCPSPSSGSGTGLGDTTVQIGVLLPHVVSDPAWEQECNWTEHPHQPISGRTPLEVPMTPSAGESGCA